MKNFLLFSSCLLVCFSTFCNVTITGQYDDKLIFDGKEYGISEYLMEPYFEKFSEKKPKLQIESTALSRGYIATYKFFEDQLYVINIEIQVKRNDNFVFTSVYNEIFPGTKRKKIDWKTGLLLLPYGGLSTDLFDHHNHYLILELKKGKIKEYRDYKIDELMLFKERQYNKFKCTRRYKRLVRSFQKNRTPKMEKKKLDYIFQMKILEHSKKFLTD